MRRITALLITSLVLAVAVPAAAGEVDVSDLVSEASRFADTEVTVIGELVGDYGNRRDGWTWTQLNGDAYVFSPIAAGGELSGSNIGIGVRIPTELTVGLDAPGGYRTVGPVVRVTGIWRYHDPGRQGETYLDVASLEVLDNGQPLEEPLGIWNYVVAVVLMGSAAVVWRSYATRRDAVS